MMHPEKVMTHFGCHLDATEIVGQDIMHGTPELVVDLVYTLMTPSSLPQDCSLSPLSISDNPSSGVISGCSRQYM